MESVSELYFHDYCRLIELLLSHYGIGGVIQIRNSCFFVAMVVVFSIAYIVVMAIKQSSLLPRVMTPCTYPVTAFGWLLVIATMMAYGALLLFVIYRWIVMNNLPVESDFLRMAWFAGLAYIASGFVIENVVFIFRALQQSTFKWSKK